MTEQEKIDMWTEWVQDYLNNFHGKEFEELPKPVQRFIDSMIDYVDNKTTGAQSESIGELSIVYGSEIRGDAIPATLRGMLDPYRKVSW